jgi:uncharacterized protein YjiS (DUF1127 family)
MTMLSNIPGCPPATIRNRRHAGRSLVARFRRLIDRLVAAAIAHHERQAELVALREFSDRELQDIGIYRCQIDYGLQEAAETRARLQRLDR